MEKVLLTDSAFALHKRLFSLAIPMILSNVTVPLLGMVDTAVIGHLPHAYYLGATTIGATIITFITWLCGFLRMSTTGLTAQSVGRSDANDNLLILLRGLSVAGLIGLLLISLKTPYINLGLQVSGGSSIVQYYAQQYCAIRIFGIPAALANLVLVGWLLGNHKSAIVMWLVMLTNALNVLLDLLFVLVLHWNVAGVAWATLLAEYTGLLVGLFTVYRFYRHILKTQAMKVWLKLIVDLSSLTLFFKLNRDILIRTLCLQATFIFITFQGARLGDQILAANAILLNFLLLIAFGLDGVANATEVMVGNARGRNNRQLLLACVKVSLFYTAILALLYSALFAVFGEQLISLISSLPRVNSIANHYLVWVIILPLIACWCYAFDGIYIGLMQASIMRNSMFIATFVCFFPLWYMLKASGNHALWAALVGFMVARGALLAGHFFRYYMPSAFNDEVGEVFVPSKLSD